MPVSRLRLRLRLRLRPHPGTPAAIGLLLPPAMAKVHTNWADPGVLHNRQPEINRCAASPENDPIMITDAAWPAADSPASGRTWCKARGCGVIERLDNKGRRYLLQSGKSSDDPHSTERVHPIL
ncbi:hypothetical protein CTA1_1843 [Colletotrichum tanaceti]|uniref:Uncharacterized protein n=1 Tax=Colletotrichum tanaceti TaxID=1306861 RepID=A0A4V6DGD9_9PEZI|nr:hypothetical protein CTA1_1843 [Colletotrichum tanaceti]